MIYYLLQENPNIANESVHAQAREALKKYLFYFERVSWFLFLFLDYKNLKFVGCVFCLQIIYCLDYMILYSS